MNNFRLSIKKQQIIYINSEGNIEVLYIIKTVTYDFGVELMLWTTESVASYWNLRQNENTL